MADAIAVAGGTIVSVGRRAAVRAVAGRARSIDCGGRTVMPGLVDPHLHLFALAARDAELDCTGFSRARDLLAAVAQAAARLPPNAWLRGAGVDDASLDRLPTAEELDGAAPRNPVRLRHRSRHASVLNGAALARLEGAEARVVQGRGGPSGLVAGREAAIGRVVGPLPASVLETGLVAAGRELARLGLTSVADATPHVYADLAPLRRVIATGAFPLRVFAMRRPGARAWRASERLRAGAVKILVEEGPGGLDPDPDALRRVIVSAARRGDQVAVHCVGMATLVAALDAFAAVPPRMRVGRRHRLEHVAECPPPCLERIAELGLGVVTNPAFVYWRGDRYREETMGGVRRGWLYRARSLLARGIPLAAASDAPVVPPSPWVGMMAARRRRTRGGALLGSGERLTAGEALALFTSSAAWMLRADLGRLVRGAPADLVVVEEDPLYASADTHGDPGVWLTMAGGVIAWQA